MIEALGRQKIIAEALTWQNTPYHHRAKIKGAGCDCLTFPIGVAQNVGLIGEIELPPYGPQFNLHKADETYLNGLRQYLREVEIPKPGDLVIWKFGRIYAHAAIVIDWPRIVHAHAGSKVLQEDAEAARWLSRIGKEQRPKKFFSYW